MLTQRPGTACFTGRYGILAGVSYHRGQAGEDAVSHGGGKCRDAPFGTRNLACDLLSACATGIGLAVFLFMMSLAGATGLRLCQVSCPRSAEGPIVRAANDRANCTRGVLWKRALKVLLAGLCFKPQEAKEEVISSLNTFVTAHAGQGSARNRDTLARMREALDGLRQTLEKERTKLRNRPAQ
jgi:hypothetical protein